MPDPIRTDELSLSPQTPDESKALSHVVDRFEDDLVVLEDEQARSLTVPRAWLPDKLSEGDVPVIEQQELVSEDQAVARVSAKAETRAVVFRRRLPRAHGAHARPTQARGVPAAATRLRCRCRL